jgi:hypothetical protein
VTETLVRVGRGRLDKQLIWRGVDNVAMKTLFVLVMLLAACGSKQNPAVCCTDAANCEAQGLTTEAMCTGGLICRGNTCVAEDCTSSADCEAGAPFCPSSGLCAATCDTDAECPGFGGDAADKFCTVDGTCVACRMNSDCDVAAPVCDVGACRGCKVDSECASDVCGADGSCVDSSAIVYLSTTGVDSGTCTQASPCLGLTYAATQTSDTRSTISIANGIYAISGSQGINLVTAARLDIHGNRATLTAAEGGSFIFADAITVRDLTIDDTLGNEGYALNVRTASIYNVTIKAGSGSSGGLASDGPVDAHQLIVHGGVVGVSTSSTMTIDGGQIDGGRTGVQGSGSFQLSNLLIYGQSSNALDFGSALGATVSFSTIAGNEVSGAVSCPTSGQFVFSDSIVWVPNSQNAVGISASCQLTRMIVGPIAVPGATNVDPQFVNMAGGDYHLGAGSPAIDEANQGPATDFEGDARPQGARFDTGADEYKP